MPVANFRIEGVEKDCGGGSPQTNNASTTVPVFLIPLKMKVYLSNGSTMTFDPETIPGYTNGKTVVQNVMLSPVFDSTTTYITGTTQYIDAFQRGNFWAYAQNNNYHLLLGEPSEVGEQELDVPMTDGCVLNNSVYGFPVGSVHDTWLGPQLQTIIASLPQIQPNSLVIFLSYDVVEFTGGPTCSPAVPGDQGQHYSSGAQT